MKIHGIPCSKEEIKKWAITNLHGYYILQDISTDGINDLINKGYEIPYEDITDDITPNTCLRAIDVDALCEIITTYEPDAERIELKYPPMVKTDELSNDEGNTGESEV